MWTTRTDDKGDPENPLLRLAAAIFEKAGIPWHGRRYPAARMFNYLSDGTAEFSMLVDSPAIRDCCLRSRNPVAVTELRAYRLPGRQPITRPEDLKGKRIIAVRGYSYGGLLATLSEPSSAVVINTAIKHDAAFAMLEAGRGDYLLEYTGPANEVLAAHPLTGLQYDVLSRLEVYLVLAKAYPDAVNVMAKLEAIAQALDKEAITGIPSR